MITRTNKDVKSTTEIKRRLLLDIGDLASFIEDTFSLYFRPHPPGVYLRDHSEPILVPGKNYWFEKVIVHDAPALPFFRYDYVPIHSLEEVLNQPWDVVDANPGDVVVAHRDLRWAALQPNGPAHGIQIAKALVLNEVESRLNYKKYMRRLLEDIICEHLDDAHRGIGALRSSVGGQELIDAVFEEAREMFQMVRDFMGNNGWLMHEVIAGEGSTLYLDQQSDYRIYDWERKMTSGVWK